MVIVGSSLKEDALPLPLFLSRHIFYLCCVLKKDAAKDETSDVREKEVVVQNQTIITNIEKGGRETIHFVLHQAHGRKYGGKLSGGGG